MPLPEEKRGDLDNKSYEDGSAADLPNDEQACNANVGKSTGADLPLALTNVRSRKWQTAKAQRGREGRVLMALRCAVERP